MKNPHTRDQIRLLYREHGGNIFKVARELGIKPGDIRRELMPAPVLVRPDFGADQPKPGRDEKGYLALGRPDLRPFIVSYRHCVGGWPDEDRSKLARARQAYDAGTHIMTQGRDGCWIIQYLWERRRRVAPINWFYGAWS